MSPILQTVFCIAQHIPFGFVRKPWMVNGLLRFFNRKILSGLLCACNCCNWLMPRCVACRIAFKLRCRRPRKKWTAGFAKPISLVDPCGDESVTFSSHADKTSSAILPCNTRSKWPVSICHTYTVPSEQPMIRKSSNGLHLILVTGNKCLWQKNAVNLHQLISNPLLFVTNTHKTTCLLSKCISVPSNSTMLLSDQMQLNKYSFECVAVTKRILNKTHFDKNAAFKYQFNGCFLTYTTRIWWNKKLRNFTSMNTEAMQ